MKSLFKNALILSAVVAVTAAEAGCHRRFVQPVRRVVHARVATVPAAPVRRCVPVAPVRKCVAAAVVRHVAVAPVRPVAAAPVRVVSAPVAVKQACVNKHAHRHGHHGHRHFRR